MDKVSHVILRVSNIKKQAREMITQAINPGRSETQTNECIDKINCAT